MGVKNTRKTPYNPKSNGLVERFNRTLLNTVASMMDSESHQRDWDKYIPFATAAYRSSPQESTGETPNMLMLGREVTLPIDLVMPPTPLDEDVNTDYAFKLRDTLRTVHEKARRKDAGSRQRTIYNRRASDADFDVGQYVWLRKKNRKKGVSPKLEPRWLGPFLIISKLSAVTFRLQQTPRSLWATGEELCSLNTGIASSALPVLHSLVWMVHGG
ncbi:uncharacterized protein LOC135155237 [Lytechinus pictus]|uniref:uncharacterized protein LOC135155237 n=1 Tax=Lytechinus pictus TaxID=7653 RepID=UPI0030B9B244